MRILLIPPLLFLPLLTIISQGIKIQGSEISKKIQMEDNKMQYKVEQKGKVIPFKTKTYQLKNGLKVTFVNLPQSGLFAYYTAMRVGSRDEVEPGHSGFAHLFEHMMFRGTKNLPGAAYDNAVTAMGADSSAWTWNDQTVYFFVAPPDRLPKVVEMEAERFKNLFYSEAEFKTESGAVLGEYNKNFSNPVNKLEEALFDTAFTRHTYKHTTMGFLEDIKAMPRMYNYSLQFFKRHYVPSKALIFVAGTFDENQALKLIEKNYGDWEGEGWETNPPVEPPQNSQKKVHIDWKSPVLPMMLLGYKIPAYSTENKISASIVIAGELLFGKASALYEKLVLKEQCIESIDYWDWQQRDPGLFIVEVVLKEPNFEYVISSIDEEIKKISEGNIETKAVEDAISHYKYNMLLNMDTAKNIARNLAFYATLDGDPMSLDKFLQRIEEVSKEDVMNAAINILKSTRRTIATLSFKKSAQEEKR